MSDQLITALELYGMQIHQKISMSKYEKLNRFRNFDAINERIETGAVVTSRGGLSDIEREKKVCYRWKAKGQCSKGDQCSFRHESNDRAKPTPKSAPPSEPQSSKTQEKEMPQTEASLRSSINRRVITS